MFALFTITHENLVVHVICNYFSLRRNWQVLSFVGVHESSAMKVVPIGIAFYFSQINRSFDSLIPDFVNFSAIFSLTS